MEVLPRDDVPSPYHYTACGTNSRSGIKAGSRSVVIDKVDGFTMAETISYDEYKTVCRDSLILPRQYVFEVTELRNG